MTENGTLLIAGTAYLRQYERAAGQLTRLDSSACRSDGKSNAHMAATEQAAADIEMFANSLEGSNGGPTLSDSSIISEQSPTKKLTVNGVSVG